jgi:hypothetical protein
MTSKINFNKISTKDFKNGRETKYSITKTDDNDTFSTDEITSLYNKLMSKKESKNGQIMIRAEGINRWNTLATYSNGLMVQDYNEYFNGKVLNPDKFEDFYQLQIFIKEDT